MTINTDYTIAGPAGNIPAGDTGHHHPNGLFADFLAQQVAMAGSATSSAPPLGAQQNDEDKGEFAVIKEKGIVAYIRELHAKRIREEILESMGLTEEALAEMPPDERAAIEKRIAEETRKRMAAEALMDNDDKETTEQDKLKDILLGPGSAAISVMTKPQSNEDLLADRQEVDDV